MHRQYASAPGLAAHNLLATPAAGRRRRRRRRRTPEPF
jgi:hypothetical protein